MSWLKLSDFNYAYGTKRALQDVSFEAPRGQFYELLGPKGAGKSTLFGLLARPLTTPTGAI